MPVQLNGPVGHDFSQPLGLLSDCHRRIEQFLSVLARVVERFGGKPLTDEGYQALVVARQYFEHAAPKHTADEEESLFPRMRAAAAAKGEDCSALDQLEADHDAADALLDRVNEVLDEWMTTRRALSERETSALRDDLNNLIRLYTAHIRIEDRDIFPLAARLLSDEAIRCVGEEMRNRRGLSHQSHV